MAFPTTRWSLLAQATIHGDLAANAALAEFYRRYREPVVGFIARQPRQETQAEDLAQEFFLHLIQGSALRRADRARGRFRSFLLGALVRFLARERERAEAEKRGAGAAAVSLDAAAPCHDELTVPADIAAAFDREWARDLILRARGEVEAAWRAKEGMREFAVLREFLPGATATPPYEAAAEQLGWPLARLKTEVHRLRRQFRDQVRAEVALTVDAPHEVDAEMSHLRAVLAGAPA